MRPARTITGKFPLTIAVLIFNGNVIAGECASAVSESCSHGKEHIKLVLE